MPKVEYQMTNPTINVRNFKTKNITISFHAFDNNDVVPRYSSGNLQSYNYSRSIDNYVGNFSFTFVEPIGSKSIVNKINNLDIVQIYEDNEDTLSFCGIVTSIGVGAFAGGARTISINGKSAECLFDMLNISVDESAMTFFMGETNDIKTTVDLCKRSENGDRIDSLALNSFIKKVWGKFTSVTNNRRYNMISSWAISDLILYCFNKNVSNREIQECEFWNKNSCAGINFKYPVASELFSNSDVKFVSYLKNILTTPIYEIFGRINPISNSSELIIRNAPFMPIDWDFLPSPMDISPTICTNYSLRRSIDEVYTAFFPYLKGSVASPQFYKNISASTSGSQAAKKLEDKIAYYGYKPLTCTFTGFPRASDEGTAYMNNVIKETFPKLAEDMSVMFGSLDEMYSGDITIVNVHNMDKAQIGERIYFSGMEFYVTGEKHQWKYGQTPTINYSITRGGIYTHGKFKPLKNFSDFIQKAEKPS